MINITPETKNALQQAVKQVRARIAWNDGEGGATQEITSEDRLISMKKEAEGYYCKSTLRKITIVLTGTETTLLDQKITATVEVKTGANAWGSIPWGSFAITEATIDQEKGISTFVGYGGIALLQQREYQPGALTFPTTVAGLAAGIGEYFGITIDTDMTTLPNYDAPIPEDLWATISGTTYRDILEEIAGATGTIAVIGGGDDTLDFKTPPISAASETLTEANLITSKIGEKWGKVSAVTLSRQPQNDNIVVTDPETEALPAGKNLINPDSLPARAFSGGETNYYMQIPTGVRIEAGKTYTLSIYVENVSVLPYVLSVGVGENNYLADVASTSNTSATEARISLTFTPTQQKIEQAGGANLFIRIPRYSAITTFTYELRDYQLEMGDEMTAYEPFTPNGLVSLTIANNEILDKQRETTAQPILDAAKGWEYRNAEIKTEGHGYHEIGDRLDISVGGTTYPTIVTKSTILVDGGISETLTSKTPDEIQINYAKSGGISKTVYRTELEVDKQEQRIDSIVSRQDATDASVQEQFTQVTQSLTNIVATAQASGGGNLIMNSVGFGKDSDGNLTVWEYGTGATTTTVKSQSSPASLNAGAVSGHEIMMTGASTISQSIALTPGEEYTLALRAQKGTIGSATISVGNSSETATVTLENGTAYTWNQQYVKLTPTEGANTVTISVASGTTVELTDLILTTGGATTWRQASGEIYNTQVSLDQGGVQVRSSVYTGDYVEITPLEFAGYSNAGGSMQKVFSLNRDITEVEKLEARSQIKMAPIKVVPINNSSYQGWAFVKEA